MGVVYHGEFEKQRFSNVVQSNDLVLSNHFHLTAQQMKIMLFLISRVSSFDDCFKMQEFNASDFAKVCGLTHNGRTNADIMDALEGLAKKTKQVRRKDGKIEIMQLLNRVILDQRKSVVSVSLHDSLSEYLLNLKRNFTEYELIWALSLRSKYAIKLYEVAVCIQYKKLETYRRYFAMDELIDILGCEIYANRFNAIRQRVLDPACAEINAETNINVTYEIVRDGRNAVGINLEVSRKPSVDGLALAYKHSAEMDEKRSAK